MSKDQSISGSGGMSADGEEGEGIKHRRLGFDGNETPRSVHEDASTIAPHDVVNDDLEDDSVADGAGGDGVSARRRRGPKRKEEVERDKRGNITRTLGQHNVNISLVA